MRRTLSLLATTALVFNATAAGSVPFINEFHYDNANPNAGLDVGEFIELAGPAGFSLTGWQLLRYNGNGGARYNSPGADPVLTGLSFSNQSNGFGFLAFDYPSNGIQNGSPDGLALVRPDNSVAQFLSYEGSFTAVDGPAAGMTSIDIGVAETNDTPIGFSLQLRGTGSAANFTWTGPLAATKGMLNTGQVFDANVPPPPPPGVTDRTIAEIQGAAQSSPLSGQAVRTTGIVTQVESNGYYLLSNTPDANDDTSEGVFVFVGNAPKPAVGDLLRLQGTVSEFLPGGNADNLTTTQLSGISNLTVLSVGNAFTPTIIGAGGRTPPTNVIETSPAAPYQPGVAGRDFYESLEGMIVTVQNAVATAPTIEFSNGNREIYVRSDAPTTGLNSRGGLTISAGDFNPERIQIDQRGNTGVAVNTGAQLGNVTGAVSYNFGNFEVVTPAAPSFTANDPVREVSDLAVGGDRLRIATYNVENLLNGQTTRYADLAQQVIVRLKSPEVIALQEIVTTELGQAQNPLTTLRGVVAAITAAGGPTYSIGVKDFAGVNDDRIVNAFLYDEARVELVGEIDFAPGSTTNAAFDDSRAPLVGTFRFNGQDVVVVNNHFSSRGGSDPLFGTVQPPINGSEDRRQLQGEFINAYVDALLGSNPDAKIAVVGDLNSFYFEEPQLALKGLPGQQVLFGLDESLPASERFNYNFDGNGQALDYIYASMGLNAADPLFDVVRFNSDFFDQFSDHDPLIASFLIAAVPAPAAFALFGLGVAGIAIARRRRAVAG